MGVCETLACVLKSLVNFVHIKYVSCIILYYAKNSQQTSIPLPATQGPKELHEDADDEVAHGRRRYDDEVGEEDGVRSYNSGDRVGFFRMKLYDVM